MAAPELTLASEPARGASIGRRVGLVDLVAISVAVGATLALVLPYFTRRPYWFDETVSLEIASLSPRLFVEYVVTVESNMGLYHAVLGAWLQITQTETGVRALSIAFALLALPFLYALARQLFDRTTATIAVLLMSVNVSFVGYSRDARSYALTLLLVTASWYFLVRARERSRMRDWVLYVVTAALAVWAHLFAVLVVIAQLTWLGLLESPSRRRDVRLAVSALAVLLLPLGLMILFGGQHAQLDWLPRPGPQKLPGLFQWFLESRTNVVVYFVGGMAALVAGLHEWRRDRSRWPQRETLLLLWLLLPPVVAFAVSYATPVYHYRYFLVCLPALVLLVSAGFARIRPVWLGTALVVAAVALSVRTVSSCQPDCKIRHDDWEMAATYLQTRARPGDAIVVYPEQIRTPLDHYLRMPRPRLLFPERWSLVGGAAEGTNKLGIAMQRARDYRRVWLVTWWLPSEPAREALRRRATLLAERTLEGDIHLELYRPRQQAK